MTDAPAKPSLVPFDEPREGMVYIYQAVIREGHVTHLWSLANDKGGIHISARVGQFLDYSPEWSGGAETHYVAAPDYMDPERPSHEHCWVLGGPCWHDGSSLYFSENIAPMLPPPWEANPNKMADFHHERIHSELRYLHRMRFDQEPEE